MPWGAELGTGVLLEGARGLVQVRLRSQAVESGVDGERRHAAVWWEGPLE